MKVLHISTGYPISYAGGITNYVRMLATEQIKKGLDVAVLGGIDTNKENFSFKYHEYESKKIKTFSLGESNDKDGLKNIEKILKSEQYDLIHIHMMLDIDWSIIDIIKDKYKYIISLHDYFYICPRIIMVDSKNQICTRYNHDKCNKCITRLETFDNLRRGINKLSSISGINIKYPPIKQMVTSRRYKKLKELLEGAELLLPVSNRVKEIYINSDIKANYKVMHISNYSADLYEPYNNENKYTDKIDIVMLGSLTYHKGAEVLLNILRQIKNNNIKVHFYGRANGKYISKLESVGLINHGSYLPNELKKILSKMDLGLVLSIWEDNAPQVVMELLNNNVPVIATNKGGIPDFVSNDNGYIFDPNSKDEFNMLIKFLNEITREKVIQLKRNINRTKTTEEHLKELMQLYNDLI